MAHVFKKTYPVDKMAHAFHGVAPEDPLRAFLQTPWESAFAVSADGLTYTKPPSLRGVPLLRIDEDSEYWESGWTSFLKYLAQEPEQERLKQYWGGRVQDTTRLPANNRERRKAMEKKKLHTDNVSKQRKMREIFGPSNTTLFIPHPGSETTGRNVPKPLYHPNQVVNKRLLPIQGIADNQEIMYKLACKVYDLMCLHDRGELAMDPWDFLRWRINEKLNELYPFWESKGARDHVKSVISKICDDPSKAGRYSDPLLRRAIVRSVTRIQGKENVYKPEGIGANIGVRRVSAIPSHSKPSSSYSGRSGRMSKDERARAEARERDEQEKRRRERRVELQRRLGTGYQGTAKSGPAP